MVDFFRGFMPSLSSGNKPWAIYLLYSSKGHRTYIGCTVDVKRRLRQHNCEIKGGAKSTKKLAGSWKIKKVLHGFKGRSEAMRWEKILKSRYRGVEARINAFHILSNGYCPISKEKQRWYQPPANITLESF